MNNIFNQKRDGFHSRLLLYVKRKTGINFSKISKIKDGIWIASSRKESWIIKEFPNPEKLKQQIVLTKTLRMHGFNNTYQFHSVHDYGPCFFEDRYLGFLQYIEAAKDRLFQYDTPDDRNDALELLRHFHIVTSKFGPEVMAQFHQADLLAKWKKRLDQFKKNYDALKKAHIYPYLERYMKLGEHALQVMQEHKSYFTKEPHCILHGDLAHHNFIRRKDGNLFIIDFDLVCTGPKQIDILQYCNRILPAIEWSPARLFAEGEAISRYEKDRPFLAALIFPADIFREWNYFINYDKKRRNKQLGYLKDITFRQFKMRMEFSKWLLDQIK